MSEMTGSEQICKKCDRVLTPNARACSCGAPTPLASFKERIDWELKQWRSHRAGLARGR